MKNHEWVGGKLLQTNKKWSALKISQREWIYELTRNEHAAYVEANNRVPMKKRKDIVIDAVYDKVEGRGIWIPYGEFRRSVAKYIDRLNRRHPLFIPPVKKSKKPPKPKIPKEGIEGFSQDTQNSFKEKIAAVIRQYILQAHCIPTNKIRDAHLKNILRGFNSKQWKPHGKQLQSSATMITLYDELRQNVFNELCEAGDLPDISKQDASKLRSDVNIYLNERLTIRKLDKSDHKAVKDILAGHPEIISSLGWKNTTATKKESLTWISQQMKRYKNEYVGYFIVIRHESHEAVGLIGMAWNTIQAKCSLELDCILDKAHWGMGYATEGGKALLDYYFNLFGVDKIYAVMRPDETRAIALSERIGMTLEGDFQRKYKGKRIKHLIYSCSHYVYETLKTYADDEPNFTGFSAKSATDQRRL